jgi:tight adherence protein B
VPAAGVVVQDVSTEEFPEVALEVALTADLVPEDGAPQFTVLENGIEAESVRAEVVTEERDPIDVVLLLDTSGSMEGEPLAAAKTAARSFVTAMRPDDRIAVVSFSSEPRVVSELSADSAGLVAAVDSLSAGGETALHDGLIRASKAFEDNGRDRYVVVLSDGGDTTSINTIDAASDAVGAAGAHVYAVALESPEYDQRPLDILATSSGGRLAAATDVSNLTVIFEDIAQELRNLYTVAYTSARPSTKDLEIELLVRNGSATGVVVTAVENPVFTAEGPFEPPALYVSSSNPLRTLLIGALVLFAVGGGIWAFASLLAPKESGLDQLRYYDQSDGPAQSASNAQTADTSRGRVLDAIGYVAEKRGFTASFSTSLERAGLPLRVNEYIFFHLMFTLLVGALTALLSNSLVITAAVVVLAAVVPLLFVQARIDRRRAAFEEQLPDVLSLIAGSLRAGWGMQQSIGLVVEEVGDPSATEFRRVESETRFGLPFDDALQRMAERVDSDDFRWTVAAITIQREVGGNLAEVLDIVADTIRQRAELRRHVKALTAEGRFSAIALALLPFLALAGLAIIAPNWVSTLFTSTLGLLAVAVAAILMIIGVIWIVRLTKVEI